MAGGKRSASNTSASRNISQIIREKPPGEIDPVEAVEVTRQMRQELNDKGIKGFKRGGKVKKTGVYKLHKGEKVIPARVVRRSTATRGRWQ